MQTDSIYPSGTSCKDPTVARYCSTLLEQNAWDGLKVREYR